MHPDFLGTTSRCSAWKRATSVRHRCRDFNIAQSKTEGVAPARHRDGSQQNASTAQVTARNKALR
jgi:hypothetical protein